MKEILNWEDLETGLHFSLHVSIICYIDEFTLAWLCFCGCDLDHAEVRGEWRERKNRPTE